MSKPVLFALVAVALTVGPAAAQPQLGEDIERQLSVQQVQAYNATGPSNTIQLEASFDRPSGLYANGEHVQLSVRTGEDAYVTIVTVGPTGKVTQLFPNESQPQALVRANAPLQIPASPSSAQIVVGPPFGSELIKVVATSQPNGFVAANQLSGTGAFRSVDASVEDLMRNLTVAAASAPGGKFAQQNLVLHTVAQATPVAALPPAPPAQVAQAAAAPAPAPIAQPGLVPQMNNTLLLAVATDKQTYRVGERITFAATTQTACSLTVFDVAANGQARQVFPNKNATGNAIPAGQLTVVSGGSASTVIDARGPVGTSTLIAVCSTDATPATVVAPDQTNIFTAMPSLEGLRTDLLNVSRRLPSGTSITSVNLTIQP
ncbi:DUF4384 domain-containing protein [Bradyrhizobium sp. INPA03-11B]|uniref:DUF4384 domain-containing protein n=1 Tax=Bradyrhizobium sp. INPA03-11B TaxID=418598 RepID=UPI00338F8E5D